MPKLVVASVQQQMRLFDALEDYRKELNRFLYLARAKSAKLIVFPALTGVMAAAPQVEGFRMNLLRRADDRFRRQRTLWTRTRGALAGRTANLFRVSFRKALAELVQANPDALRSAYETVFSGLAQAYNMTIVAGSAYLADSTGVLRHQATVFGPDGAILGRHSKLLLGQEEAGLAQPGNNWTVVDTPAGRLGILLGEEALYPEAGRILSYQGADLLVALSATPSDVGAAYVRQAALARAQENQCFALTSFLVGKNYLSAAENGGDFVGKSGIYAPLEMTPRYTGVLVEMGTTSSEGLLTAELDDEALRNLWQTGTQPLRSRMPAQVFANYLPTIYAHGRTLSESAAGAALVPAQTPEINRLAAPEPPGPAVYELPAEMADVEDEPMSEAAGEDAAAGTAGEPAAAEDQGGAAGDEIFDEDDGSEGRAAGPGR